MSHRHDPFPTGAALAALALTTSAIAQGPTWASPNSLPAARYDHAMAFDEGRGRAVLFGGRDLGGNNFADTWEWDGAAWIQRTPAHAPSARWGASMAYDPERGVTLLFGGSTTATNLQDTWRWDGADWTQLAPGTNPPQGWGCAMTYHGGTNPGVLLHGGSSSTSTWQWNGSTWTLRGSAGPFSMGAGMAYASSHQRTILLGSAFGGSTPASAWDGNTWTQVSVDAPAGTKVVYDPVLQRLLAVGGWFNGGNYNVRVVSGQVQAPSLVTWSATNRFYPGGGASRFHGSASVYDTARGAVLTFGGLIDGVLVTQALTNQLAEAPSSTGVWSPRSPSVTASPGARTLTEMAFDGTSGKALLFGGWDGNQVLADAWTFDGRNWTNHGFAGVPARMQPGLCHVPAWGATVLFGGGDFGSTFYNDTMVWSGSGFLPTFGTGGSPPARRDHEMACDTVRNRIVMYGGYDGSYLSDTWELRSGPLGLQWSQVSPIGSPGPRNGHRMAYDQRRQKLVMFGGSNQGIFDGTTWEYTPGNFAIAATWTQMAPLQSPPPRWLHTMDYDPARGVIVLAGGYGNPTCGNFCADYLSDVWEYNGVTWTQRFPESSLQPREGAGSCYDSVRQRIVVQGGSNFFFTDETWFYNAPVDRFAEGMVGGSSVELRCLKFPVAGKPVRFSLTNASGLGWVNISPEPTPGPGLTLGPTLLCGTGTIYGFPPLLVDAMGNPGTLEFVLPLSMAGLGFVAQGVSFDFAACIRLSDPLAVTIHAP